MPPRAGGPLLDRRWRCSCTRTSATRCCSRRWLARGPHPHVRTPHRAAERLADRRRLRRGGRDRRARSRNALALDYPRDRLELIVGSDGSTDAHRRARTRPAPTSCSTCRAAARSARRTRPSSARAARSSRSPTPTRYWEPDALRELVAPFADPEVGYVCGQVRFVDDGRHEPGGRSTGATRCGSARSSRGSPASPAATARSTRRAARPTSWSTRAWATTCRSRSTWSSAAGARVYAAAARGRRRRWCPTIEGEFARKRRMMSHAWPIVIARRPALAARLRRRSTRSRSPRTACCATRSPFLHLVALAANVALLGEGAVYAVTLALQLRVPGRRRARRARAGAPFQVARYYVLVTASLAAGLWDWLRTRHARRWEKAEGTR